MNNRNLDKLIAEKIFHYEHDDIPSFSEDLELAWEVVSKLTPLVGDFQYGDGFFWLGYGESANHSLLDDPEECNFADTQIIVEVDPIEDKDLTRWSAHFHIGLLGENDKTPKHWDHGSCYCAKGKTASEAICLAALRACVPELGEKGVKMFEFIDSAYEKTQK